MTDLPESLFTNPIWHALQTGHRHFAETNGEACRYPAAVAPFAAVAFPGIAALQQLAQLLAPGESAWLIGEQYPHVLGLCFGEVLECLQMVLPQEVTPPGPSQDIVQLSAINAPEMVALTDLAFPGFFRPRTCEMGLYYGIRAHGELIAMAGERLLLPGFPEISGVCTRPDHRGKGLAARLIWQLARSHRRDGLISWLHVGCANQHAIELYLHMGFRPVRKVVLNRIQRTPVSSKR
jgi:GNAT superfamily N-acetyltransferase